MLLHIDLESRSECDLIKHGIEHYARDPTTEVLCMAYSFGMGPIWSWTPGEPAVREINAHIVGGGRCIAWNDSFESMMWAHILVPRHGFAEVPPDNWLDAPVFARALGFPSALGKASSAPMFHEAFGKDMAGHRLMLKLCKPVGGAR